MTRKTRILKKKSGRNAQGKITVRHQGGRHKRRLREIDFKRDKKNVWARVESIEYDPNRGTNIALLVYEDGERRYILSPSKLQVGSKVVASDDAPIEDGNSLLIGNIPVGTPVHNLEIVKGKGGQLVRSAGGVAVLHGKEEKAVLIKMPSSEIRRFEPGCLATVGQLSNIEQRTRRFGKAGTKRRMGIRPSVRGTAQHPGAHPHGGGEGRSGVGLKYPKTPYGKPAVGKTRRKKKYSDRLIVKGRKKGPHVG